MNKEPEQIQFRFVNIQITSKQLVEPKPVEIQVNFKIKVDTKVQADLNLVIMNVVVVIQDVKTNDMLAEFAISCFFEIIDFHKHIKLNDDQLYVIPPHLESTIKPVSISTSRGVVYSDLRGTYLQGIIMPVVYMTDFVPDNKKENLLQ
jgi:hypothetical protein